MTKAAIERRLAVVNQKRASQPDSDQWDEEYGRLGRWLDEIRKYGHVLTAREHGERDDGRSFAKSRRKAAPKKKKAARRTAPKKRATRPTTRRKASAKKKTKANAKKCVLICTRRR